MSTELEPRVKMVTEVRVVQIVQQRQESELPKSSAKDVFYVRCEYCPKKFETEFELSEHAKPCLRSRPFACEHCTRRFKTAQNLEQHTRIHTNQRPYECQFCERCFTQKSHLQQHERVHNGEPAFQCRFCGEIFTRQSQKTEHMPNCTLRELWAEQQMADAGTSSAQRMGHSTNYERERSPLDRSIGEAEQLFEMVPDDEPIQTMVVIRHESGDLDSTPKTTDIVNDESKSISLDHPSLKYAYPAAYYEVDDDYYEEFGQVDQQQHGINRNIVESEKLEAQTEASVCKQFRQGQSRRAHQKATASELCRELGGEEAI